MRIDDNDNGYVPPPPPPPEAPPPPDQVPALQRGLRPFDIIDIADNGLQNTALVERGNEAAGQRGYRGCVLGRREQSHFESPDNEFDRLARGNHALNHCSDS